MTTLTQDRIEKHIHLRATRGRVWRALTDAKEFGEWFKVRLDGDFVEGAAVHGQITHAGYEHLRLELLVEKIEPETYFSYRWHPFAIDTKTDYSSEPMTLVEFRLEESKGGTTLTIVESGFDRIPEHRRDKAFRMNAEGWSAQLLNIERHVA